MRRNCWTKSPESAVERDNGYSGIWEWYDTSADARELEIARAIAGSENAVIRFEGQQYRRDHTVSGSEKRALRNVLDAYEALRSGVT